jgi:hypothetical protein
MSHHVLTTLSVKKTIQKRLVLHALKRFVMRIPKLLNKSLAAVAKRSNTFLGYGANSQPNNDTCCSGSCDSTDL